MADQVMESATMKRYGLVYSRAACQRCRPNLIAKDDDLIIGSLPTEMMKKVTAGKSRGGIFREREALSGHYVGNVNGKESTGTKTMRENSKAECSRKQSKTGEVFLTGNGKIELETLHKKDSKNINTPMKQKRGADGEMVRAYFLSPAQSLSRLRPRKEVPAFHMVDLDEKDNEHVVGKRVKVYWSGSRRWFTGRIVAFDKINRLHRILYEDDDKEVLDLRKERFKLEVMPTDPFKLKSEPNSARKADGLDAGTGTVREALMKGNSKNVSGAKTIVKSSESKQKKEAKNEGKRTSPKAHRKNTEVIMEELVSNVDEIPEKISKVVTNKESYTADFGKAISEENESGFCSEAVKEAAKDLGVEATVSMGSDNSGIKGSRNAVEDDDLKLSISELVERPKRSGKRLVPRAKRMRTDEDLSRESDNLVEKLEADMKSYVHSTEVKTIHMDVDINGEAMEVRHQYISRNNEALGKKASERDGMSNEEPFTMLDLTSKKKTAIGSSYVSKNAANEVENLMKAETRTAAEDVIPRLLSNPHNVKDEREVVAAQTELATSINKGKDELVAVKSVQKSGDVHSMNANHEAESILEVESMKLCEASYHQQPIVKTGPEEAKPPVLKEEVKLENGYSVKESKESMDFLSEKPEIYASKESKSNDGGAS